MKNQEVDKEEWEAPSLEWIHRVRRARQAERAGRPLQLLPQKEAEELARTYGLQVARRMAVDR